MNSNSSVKIEQLSTQLNNEQLQDVIGGVWMPKPDFPPRYPFPGGSTGPFNPTPTFPRPWAI